MRIVCYLNVNHRPNVCSRSEVLSLADKMLGQNLITKQTPAAGCPVHKVMVARSVNIVRETYLCIVMDRSSNGPLLVASPDGGMDIEAVAEKTPERLLRVPIDIETGLTATKAREVAVFLGFGRTPELEERAAAEILKLWDLFVRVDAVQIEINPLAETDEAKVIAVDAKLNFDDNAQFRQKAIFELDDASDSDPREVEAAKYDLNYVAMDGSIGCLVNGAGLAMATMDIIQLHGSSPANFLDVGGNVKEEQVLRAFQILVADPKVKGILVNVFGGIVNCATIANGVVNATKQMDLKVPLVVRLEGTNVVEAKRILAESGLAIQAASDLDDAAAKIVAATKDL